MGILEGLLTESIPYARHHNPLLIRKGESTFVYGEFCLQISV